MSKRLTTLAIVSAAVLGLAGAASAQTASPNGARVNDPELNHNATSPGKGEPHQNMGTTGQGAQQAPARAGSSNGSPPAPGEGIVNKKEQQ